MKFQRLRKIIAIIQLQPAGKVTPDKLSKERYQRVAFTALSSAIARGIHILANLISIPLTLNYLGTERYGIWLVMSSITIFLGFADLGISNGLINAIAKAHGHDDQKTAQEYISNAFFILTGIAIWGGSMFIILYPHIPWQRAFHLSSPQAVLESGPTCAVFLGGFLLNLPLSVVQRVQIGYQEGFINNLWQCLGSLLALGSLLCAIHFHASLPLLVLAMVGAPIIVTGLNGIVLFGYRRPWLCPTWQAVRLSGSQYILKTGMFFLVLQIAGALGFQTDNFVIGYILGAAHVPQYAIPMRLFWLIPTLYGFFLLPLWPAYGEALVRKDIVWIRQTFVKVTFIAFGIALPVAMLLILLGPQILHLWVGASITPSFGLLAGMGTWAVLTSVNGSISMLLNGANILGFQVVCALLMGISNLALSIVLVQQIGVAGAIYGTVITVSVFNVFPAMIFIRRLFRSWQQAMQISTSAA